MGGDCAPHTHCVMTPPRACNRSSWIAWIRRLRSCCSSSSILLRSSCPVCNSCASSFDKVATSSNSCASCCTCATHIHRQLLAAAVVRLRSLVLARTCMALEPIESLRFVKSASLVLSDATIRSVSSLTPSIGIP